MATYSVFSTEAELRYRIRSDYGLTEAKINQDSLTVSLKGKDLVKVDLHKVSISCEKTQMIAVDDYDLARVDHAEDNLNLLYLISKSDDVKDLDISPTSINFTYKDRYDVKVMPRSIDDLMIKDLKSSQFELVTLPHFSRIFEILDKNIKEFAK